MGGRSGGGGRAGRGGGGGGSKYAALAGKTITVTPRQTGWRSTVTFSIWEGKGGQRRLYGNRTDYDRKGIRRNSYSVGYIDLSTGNFVGKIADKKFFG